MSSAEKKRKYLAISIFIIVTGVGFGVYCGELDALFYIVSEKEVVEFNDLSQRYAESLWAEPNRAAADDLVGNLKNTSDGYYFIDINYEDESRASWQTRAHLARLSGMINDYGKDLIAANETIRSYVIGTLDYWLNNDFKNSNWWYNEISTPQYMADIGIMLKDHVSEKQIDKMKKIIKRGTLSYCHDKMDWTGANLLDAVETTLKYSFFADRPYLLKKAVAQAEKEIFLSDGDTEGIKYDYTFYQHGAQQAITSYGQVYVNILTQLAQILDGTSFQFSEEKMDILVNFILFGQRYAIRGNRSNYLANGRSFSRKNGNNAGAIKNSIEILLSLEDSPKKGELQEFHNSFNNFSYSLNDTKYFPYSYTLFDISPDHYMAVKGAHQGFVNSELVNSENRLSRNLGYGGITTYQYTGNEYDEISALWDFSKLPGSTAYNETDEELIEYHKNSTGYRYKSSTTHSDGKAEGNLGGLYVDIENEEGLYSRQAYISKNGLMVCLGNSLSNSKTDNNKEVCTTINQVYVKDSTYKSNEVEGALPIDDNSAIFNGNFAYYNLEGDNLIADVSNVTGNLNRNNLAQFQEYSDDIFTLYYNHGKNPENQKFVYAVLANSEGNAPASSEKLPIAEITNENAVQAVDFTDGTAVIIFHEAGTFTTFTGNEISADGPEVRILK